MAVRWALDSDCKAHFHWNMTVTSTYREREVDEKVASNGQICYECGGWIHLTVHLQLKKVTNRTGTCTVTVFKFSNRNPLQSPICLYVAPRSSKVLALWYLDISSRDTAVVSVRSSRI